MEIDKIWNTAQSYFNNFQNVSLMHGGISLDDMNELAALVGNNHYKTNHNRQNIKIAELGSWTGMSTSLLATIAKENNGEVYAVDTFAGADTDNLQTNAIAFNIKKIFMTNLKNQDLLQYVKIHEGTTEEASKFYPDNYFDVVFIDADHRYASVKKDIELWYPKVKQGGLICGHDCDVLLFNGIDSLMEKFGDKNWCGFHIGVAKAVSEAFPDARKCESGVVWYKVK